MWILDHQNKQEEHHDDMSLMKAQGTFRSLPIPGLLAVEQTKSAFRGSRSSCRVMEPLEADMRLGSGAPEAFFCPVGSPLRRSSSAFKASLFSAKKHNQQDNVQLTVLSFPEKPLEQTNKKKLQESEVQTLV